MASKAPQNDARPRKNTRKKASRFKRSAMLMMVSITYGLDLVHGFKLEDTKIVAFDVRRHAARAIQFLWKCGTLVARKFESSERDQRGWASDDVGVGVVEKDPCLLSSYTDRYLLALLGCGTLQSRADAADE
ncbi:hypothetical protein IW261DRAFT_1423822 [Armillaria novae-zelandiae]|uniref:Uncharacterized protein n=1 Tax=Armillaria novae-zelandiae TaxID=153914 RepID=A0AA39NW95_9AGAR|nr:hypothetical protein IW261DRAFT_1423822 [Armillaria novae-zelandiae]